MAIPDPLSHSQSKLALLEFHQQLLDPHATFMTPTGNTWHSEHLPPAQVSHLESFFQRCPGDAHFSHANARITESPKLSKSHFPQFHYLPFKNTQPDHKKTRLLLPVQPGGCSNSAPLSFIQVGDEYSHLGIPLSFKTISQSVAAFIVPGLYIPPLGITV